MNSMNKTTLNNNTEDIKQDEVQGFDFSFS